MISFIICSIHPDKLNALKQSIKQTIGIEHEFIAVDNSTTNYPIGKAYNIGAQLAQYPYLCFTHEDIIFESQNWGAQLIAKLAEPKTGIIGFAGSVGKTATLSTWAIDQEHSRCNFTEITNNKTVQNHFNINQDFEPVITLDGLCLFMRADLWEKIPFDCETFDGFHFYDIDICISTSTQKYQNYVCLHPSVQHHSKGSFNKQWYKYALKFQTKWAKSLPLFLENFSQKQINMLEKEVQRRMTYFLLKRSILAPQPMLEMIKTSMRNNPEKISSYYLYYRYLRYLGEKNYLDNSNN